MASKTPTPATAYSYIRFSSRKQEEGDSIRRQTDLTTEWAKRNGAHLDTSLKIDRGVSAFRGKNKDLGSLGEFLRQVENGRVVPGSYLVVESLDRLTREDVQPALVLILNLLQKGIRVVQLRPVEVVYDSSSDTLPIMMMVVELSRGHSESKVKSERVADAWGQRRKAAREGAGLMTHKLPAWVKVEDGEIVAIPERAEAVKRIFELSGQGLGLLAVMNRLNEERVAAFGPSGRWSVTYIDNILKDRRALGEYQPRARVRGQRKEGEPTHRNEGEPIADYFPRIVGDAAWELARQGTQTRNRKKGRIGELVNVFQGLLRGARDGEAYVVAQDGTSKGEAVRRIIKGTGYRKGLGRTYSFPLDTFERGVLKCLRELDASAILPPDTTNDAVQTLAGELAGVEREIAAIVAEMDKEYSDVLAGVLRRKEAKKKELAGKLAELRQSAANPLSEAWGETKALLNALDNAPNPKEARMNLRAALRRVVDSIWVLPVPRGRDRLCAVQVWFSGGERFRTFLIAYRPTKANARNKTDGAWAVISWAWDTADGESPFDSEDLRNRDHAGCVAGYLEALPIERIDELLATGTVIPAT